MTDRVVDRRDWGPFTDRLSRLLEGSQAEIEVAGLGIGDQMQTRWLPLVGVAYDPRHDSFEIAVEGLDHLVLRPQTLVVDHEGALLQSLAVATMEGERHILRFREPLRLPPPDAANP